MNAETSYDISVYIIDSNGRESNFYKYNIATEIELIAFKINGTFYYAEDGMTWGEWVNSEYNTCNLRTACTDGTGGIKYNSYFLYNSVYSYVLVDDLIVENESYTHNTSGPPDLDSFLCIG